MSILINPLLFAGLDRLKPWLERREGRNKAEQGVAEADSVPVYALEGHTVLVGFGRVGHLVAAALLEQNKPFVVIENHRDVVSALSGDGVPALYGNGVTPGMMEAASIASARWLLVAIPDPIEAGLIIARARELNPDIEVVARAHSSSDLLYLEKHGAHHMIMGEREIAEGMSQLVLRDGMAPA